MNFDFKFNFILIDFQIKRSYEEEEAILNMAGVQTRHAQEQF